MSQKNADTDDYCSECYAGFEYGAENCEMTLAKIGTTLMKRIVPME